MFVWAADVLTQEINAFISYVSGLPRIYWAKKPLFSDHLETLKALEEVPTAVAWQAGRANRDWVCNVREMLRLLNNKDILERIKVKTEQDTPRAQIFFRLVVSFAAVRVWGMLIYDLPPEQWAGILSDNAKEAFHALGKAKATCTMVRNARAAAQDAAHPKREAPVLERSSPVFAPSSRVFLAAGSLRIAPRPLV